MQEYSILKSVETIFNSAKYKRKKVSAAQYLSNLLCILQILKHSTEHVQNVSLELNIRFIANHKMLY